MKAPPTELLLFENGSDCLPGLPLDQHYQGTDVELCRSNSILSEPTERYISQIPQLLDMATFLVADESQSAYGQRIAIQMKQRHCGPKLHCQNDVRWDKGTFELSEDESLFSAISDIEGQETRDLLEAQDVRAMEFELGGANFWVRHRLY